MNKYKKILIICLLLLITTAVFAKSDPEGQPFSAIMGIINKIGEKIKTLETNLSNLSAQIGKFKTRLDNLENRVLILEKKLNQSPSPFPSPTPSPASILSAVVAVDNPASSNIYSDRINGVTTEVTLLKFNFTSTIGDSTLTKLTVNIPMFASSAVPSVIYLYDGDTLVSTATPSNGQAVLKNFRLPVSKNATKNIAIKANFLALEDLSQNVVNMNIPVTGSGSIFERPDGSTHQTVISSAINGNPQFLFEQGVKFAFVSGTNVVSSDGRYATGTINLNIQPFGGTLTEFTTATDKVGIENSITVLAYDSSGNVLNGNILRVLKVNPDRNISDGESATVTVSTAMSISEGASGPGLVRFKITAIYWRVGSRAMNQFDSTTAGNMFDNWATNYANLQ